ncbi:MAG: phosphopantetheine-binding protein, partial [Pseudomonadota bacterium]
IHDNFFDLGGHSLLAMRVISLTSGAWNQDVPIRTLFQYPQLSAMAESLDRQIDIQVLAPIPKIERRQGRSKNPTQIRVDS